MLKVQKYSTIIIGVSLCIILLFSACAAKKNPRYDPKKCKTCPTFSMLTYTDARQN